MDRMPHDLVDLARYPIADLDDALGRRLVREARARLAEDGALALPGFLTPAAVRAIQDEAAALLPLAYFCAHGHNVFLVEDDPAFPPDHPRNRPQASDLGCIADDRIPAGHRLRALYAWPVLHAFLAAVLDKPALYPYADALGSLNINVAREGQQLGWHFDNADFATTLMLQRSEGGGDFEYHAHLRRTEGDSYAAIGGALQGARPGLRRIDGSPGTLVLFRGRYSLHRVTPITGRTPRLTAVLSYDPEPGVMLTEHTRLLFYGRVA